MSNDEMNLTTANGYPINHWDKGRRNEPLDLQATTTLWWNRGKALAGSQGDTFTLLFYDYINSGSHPEVAFQTALDAIGVEWKVDKFLTIDKNETIEI